MTECIDKDVLREHLKHCINDPLFCDEAKRIVIAIDIYVKNMPSVQIEDGKIKKEV